MIAIRSSEGMQRLLVVIFHIFYTLAICRLSLQARRKVTYRDANLSKKIAGDFFWATAKIFWLPAKFTTAFFSIASNRFSTLRPADCLVCFRNLVNRLKYPILLPSTISRLRFTGKSTRVSFSPKKIKQSSTQRFFN